MDKVIVAIVLVGVVVILHRVLGKRKTQNEKQVIRDLTGVGYDGPIDRVWAVISRGVGIHQYALDTLLKTSKHLVSFTDPGNFLIVIEHPANNDGERTYLVGNLNGNPTARITRVVTTCSARGLDVEIAKEGSERLTVSGTGSELMQQILSAIN